MSEPMTQCQRVARIVAELLSYPDAAWREKRTELEAAIQTVDDESMAAVLNAFVEHAFLVMSTSSRAASPRATSDVACS